MQELPANADWLPDSTWENKRAEGWGSCQWSKVVRERRSCQQADEKPPPGDKNPKKGRSEAQAAEAYRTKRGRKELNRGIVED